MNTLWKFLFTLVALFTFQLVSAQCHDYFQFTEGKSWTYENYNDKDKLQGSQQQEVTAFEETDGGYAATLNVKSFDKKGNESGDGELEMICDNGTFTFDMRRFVSEEQMSAMENFAVEVEAENLTYPSDLEPGQSLPDGSITVTAVGTTVPMKITINITDRKVESMESVSTPMGDFDALKITSNSTMTNQMGINMTFEFEQVEWIAKEVGMVKSESYRKGKMQGYSVLTEMK